ncbi:MAG: hypothetical protein IRY85_21575, partial [Micromonosporaceae bacterium]|nr:hypothetical protein [Micromonosporaceae bacterium]
MAGVRRTQHTTSAEEERILLSDLNLPGETTLVEVGLPLSGVEVPGRVRNGRLQRTFVARTTNKSWGGGRRGPPPPPRPRGGLKNN